MVSFTSGTYKRIVDVGHTEIRFNHLMFADLVKQDPGRTINQEQEDISPNHVQRLNLISVERSP